ncbi:MAG: phosphatidylserine/phosphatidylglycerophosphate/cardiolipin synthase family protein, partial [Proteobacteria bacterium]|nr:phosphatidylserine/phosphatidylglycerophosphate/cardiolipin synthase family protein [Pseudomonadota bacterium]
CSDVANLEIVPLDIWGRDLEQGSLKLSRDPVRVPDPSAGPGVTLIRFGDAGTLQVLVEVEDHLELSIDVTHNGGGSFTVEGPANGRLVTSSASRVLSGTSCPVVSIYAGLDHAWFAAATDAPTWNDSTFLMDGQDYWASVAADLPGTRERISLATWWWMSDFELTRDPDDHDLASSARERQTVMSRVNALDGVHKRVLINRFWDENSDWAEYLNTDSELREAAETSGDGFEVVLQGNPTDVPVTEQYQGQPADFDFTERVAANERYANRVLVSARSDDDDWTLQAASYHQKFLVLDGEVAYVTGMNVKSTDWDTHDHVVFEPGRMGFDADQDDREAVAAEEQLPDLGPRKDYGMRVRGPAAWTAERLFLERWDLAMEEGDLHSERASSFELDAPAAEVPEGQGGVLTQIQATLPEPWADMSIFESHAKAVQAATEYIFVEDQYFRAPMLLDLVVERMNAEP